MTNGEKGLLASVTDLSSKIVGTLPPAFLLLVVLNVCFLGMVMWFLDSQLDSRVAILKTVLENCMKGH